MRPDNTNSVFGTKVTSETLNLWRVDGKTHGVGLMELYAAVAALKTWANIPKVQHVCHLIYR